jgi:hypothetical protein
VDGSAGGGGAGWGVGAEEEGARIGIEMRKKARDRETGVAM